jgi:hypothetical protein
VQSIPTATADLAAAVGEEEVETLEEAQPKAFSKHVGNDSVESKAV